MKAQLILLSAALAAIALGVFALRPTPQVAPSAQRTEEEASAPQSAAAVAPMLAPAPRASQHAPTASPPPVADEAAFMRDLRALADLDAEATIERAREGAARFGASSDAPERRSILIHALARMGYASEARGEAEAMVNECPDSSWVREVERFTGAHRHRNIRLAADGQLEYW
ncbi:MAG TPA: hypothetical protein VER96_37125 [Polyangiaceae bacterium]|nr:hypothetical protein [Polyangiaceae bacterium]